MSIATWVGPLPPKEPQAPFRLTLREAVRGFEEGFILDALRRNGWNLAATSRELGMGYSTLKERVRRYRESARADLD